jgi:hypothetical protein
MRSCWQRPAACHGAAGLAMRATVPCMHTGALSAARARTSPCWCTPRPHHAPQRHGRVQCAHAHSPTRLHAQLAHSAFVLISASHAHTWQGVKERLLSALAGWPAAALPAAGGQQHARTKPHMNQRAVHLPRCTRDANARCAMHPINHAAAAPHAYTTCAATRVRVCVCVRMQHCS